MNFFLYNLGPSICSTVPDRTCLGLSARCNLGENPPRSTNTYKCLCLIRVQYCDICLMKKIWRFQLTRFKSIGCKQLMQAVHGPNASWMNLAFQTFAYQWSFLGTIVSMMSGWPKPMVSTCLCLCGGHIQPEILVFWFGRKNQRNLQDLRGCCPYWAAWCGPSTKSTITNWKKVVIAFALQKLVVTGLGIVFFGKWTVIGMGFGLALFATSKSLDTSPMQSSTTFPGFQTSVLWMTLSAVA